MRGFWHIRHMPVLRAQQLRHDFGSLRALDDVSLEVRPLAPAVKYEALATGGVDVIDGYSTRPHPRPHP